MRNTRVSIASIKQVLSGDAIVPTLYEWGEGRLDREPVLQPDEKDKRDPRYPQFFRDDGMSREPSNKDPIEELK